MLDKRLSKKINFIEIYQIIGGIAGILFTLNLIFTTGLSTFLNLAGYFTMITPFLFFGLCIYSGILLNKKKYKAGFNLVILTLALQLVGFQISGLYYTVINGLAFDFSVNLTNDCIVGFHLQFSQFLFRLHSELDNYVLNFNLMAVGMLFYTAKVFREIKQ